MFDFETLEVYKKSRELNKIIWLLVKNKKIEYYIRDQILRASLSIMANIAEGSGKVSPASKRNFYVIARGSAYECVAFLDVMFDNNIILEQEKQNLYQKFEEISKMLLAMINNFK